MCNIFCIQLYLRHNMNLFLTNELIIIAPLIVTVYIERITTE